MLRGIPVSKDVGIGRAVIMRQQETSVIKTLVTDVKAEKRRLAQAIEIFDEELRVDAATLLQNAGQDEADILLAYIIIANDPELVGKVESMIEKEKVSAAYAFFQACNIYITLFSGMQDEIMQARAADFKDIRERMICILLGIKRFDPADLPEGSVLIAEDITPGVAAVLDPKRIKGIVMQSGTKFSHIAIIARAMQIPAVVAVTGMMRAVKEGDKIIVDGETGEIHINPEQELLAVCEKKLASGEEERKELEFYKHKDTYTKDGKRIRLAANLAISKELESALENRADGIGLLRTEFLYMNDNALPNEQKQFLFYKKMAEEMGGQPVIIRTLDIGGDKEIPYLGLQREENPFLGCRAIRFCLERKDIFRTQIRALLRANAFGCIRIMLPMISCISEVRKTKAIMEDVKEELRRAGTVFNGQIQIGIMIETPATAICADLLAKEVDFFSIGTNDLTQYILAVDRGNEKVASLYSPFHPAVLRMIQKTVDGARQGGIMVGVCGEVASEPLMIPILIGLGVKELSVNTNAILPVRRQIAKLTEAECNIHAQKVLELTTPEEVTDYIKEFLYDHENHAF